MYACRNLAPQSDVAGSKLPAGPVLFSDTPAVQVGVTVGRGRLRLRVIFRTPVIKFGVALRVLIKGKTPAVRSLSRRQPRELDSDLPPNIQPVANLRMRYYPFYVPHHVLLVLKDL